MVSQSWLLGKLYQNFQLLANQEFWPFKPTQLLLRIFFLVFSWLGQYSAKFLSDWLQLFSYWNYPFPHLSADFINSSFAIFSLKLWFWRVSGDYESLDCHLVTLSNFYWSRCQSEQMIEYCQSSLNFFSSAMLLGRFWAWTFYAKRPI